MFKTFFGWLFDGKRNSEIPDKGNLLRYNSPITPMYLLRLFTNNGELNFFLNQYFNNMGLLYLDKEEFFKFIKQCVIDYKVKRNSIPFISFKKDSKIFEELRKRFPLLKSNDILLFSSLIDKDPERDSIYRTLGLSEIKKEKINKTEQKDHEKITVEEFIQKNFSVVYIK